jgi:hypothetical protein
MGTKQRQILTISESNLADATKTEYDCRLNAFFKESSIKSYDELVKVPNEELENSLVEYCNLILEKVKKGQLSPNTVPKMFKPIKFVLGINYRENDVRWRPLESLFPQSVRRSGYKAWSTPQVSEMIEKCTGVNGSRNKALVHFMASIGGRVGIHDHPLLMKHLIPMSSDDSQNMDCFAVLLYAEDDESAEEKDYRDSSKDVVSGESYWAFLTPEASKWLKRYHGERQRCGEMFDDETPIFRNEYSALRPNANTKQLSKQGVFLVFNRVVKSTSITRIMKGRRYDTQLMHGFRKRFNTVMKLQNSVNANIAEKIMGHKNGLDGVYFVPTRQQCFKEFVKGISELTIDSRERQKIELKEKSGRIDELEKEREVSHTFKLKSQESEDAKNKVTNQLVEQSKKTQEYIESLQMKIKEIEKNSLEYHNKVDDARKEGLDHATKMIEDSKKEISPDKIQQILNILKSN